jgi:hypothetical protein
VYLLRGFGWSCAIHWYDFEIRGCETDERCFANEETGDDGEVWNVRERCEEKAWDDCEPLREVSNADGADDGSDQRNSKCAGGFRLLQGRA